MKITNDNIKELKQLADEKGIKYNKNANVEQMKQLLADIQEWSNEDKSDSITVKKSDFEALLNKFENLENLVRTTGDQNKIKDFEDTKKNKEDFSFSVKLFPTENYNCPIISWRTISNFVDLSKQEIEANQIIEITYITKDWEEKKRELELLQFATFLQRTKPIIAKKILNLDNTEVYIDKKINPETKAEYFTLKPKSDTFNVVLNVEWQELTILSTYLNA